MGQTLRRSSISKILLFTAFLVGFAFQAGYSQTTLSPGDLAIVTVNADENDDGDKSFDFVPLVDLEKGTEIKFTDAPYIESDDEIEDSEGTVIFTVPNDISAGKIVTYSEEDEGVNGFRRDGNFNPSTVGDNIIVYQGTRNDSPVYIFGIGWARGESWTHSGSNSSDIPPDLSKAGNQIVYLGTADNYQYDAGNGTEGTAKSLLHAIADENNWNEDDDNAFSSFSSDFTLVDPPTIAFSESALTISEGESATLPVELVEASGTAVNVDVVFLSNASTADNGDDFGTYTTDPVRFDAQASTGDTRTVTIALNDDSEFENSEKAVFQLQNSTEGTIIEPQELTLTIEDENAPDVVINEILADPGGADVDGNGSTGASNDEFVEFVNTSDTDIDISGWAFSDDGSDIVKTFPEGTVIPAERALVLFNNDVDNGTPKGHFSGAIVQITDRSLSLNNDGDTPTLFDGDGNIIDQVDYSSSKSGVSMNRNFNGSEVELVDHTELSSESYSPGTKADGTPFGSKFAVGIRGTEGWRIISSPVQNATFDDFFADVWTQGIAGADANNRDAPNIFTYDEPTADFDATTTYPYIAVEDMNSIMTPGKGYLVYVYEDDEYSTPGIQGGFPKVINSNGSENEGRINIPVSATDVDESGNINGEEGWNLLGNPFDTDITASAVLTAMEAVNAHINENIYVYDNDANGGNGDWLTLSGDDTIAPFQGFFVRFTATGVRGDAAFNKSDLEANTGTDFFKNKMKEVITFDLELHGEEFYDTYSLEFSENGTIDLDRYDAYKLFSLNTNAISLFSLQDNNRLQKNVLPADLESALEIPLSFQANNRTSLTFRWDNEMKDIPPEWDFILIDEASGREINLRSNDEYIFNTQNSEAQQKISASNENGLLNKANNSQDSRFTLSVQPNVKSTASNNLPESVKLKPNYPNPFNPTTRIPYELTKESEVLLTVWNMIGQKVETLVDGTKGAGTYEAVWNASNMPSGMYIARFEVDGTVFTRKMTLIK